MIRADLSGFSFRFPSRRFSKRVHRAYRGVGRFPRTRKMDRKMQRLARKFANGLFAALGNGKPARKWLSWGQP